MIAIMAIPFLYFIFAFSLPYTDQNVFQVANLQTHLNRPSISKCRLGKTKRFTFYFHEPF